MTDSHSSSSLLDRPLGDLVMEHSQAAAIFERFGLDYCCHGHQTLAEAAQERGVTVDEVLNALASLGGPPVETSQAFGSADLDSVTRHIVDHHHHYVRETTPTITRWLDKLVLRHGTRHPELAEVRATFERIAEELMAHMAKEENILFPFIDAMAVARRAGERLPSGPFGTVLNPVRVMEEDHQLVGELLTRLRALTGGFAAPPDGCRTFTLCYAELARYAADLHRHIHLENHVLFPRALDLERALVS
jgi:regulator of cell morphogenesis and NO signaling